METDKMGVEEPQGEVTYFVFDNDKGFVSGEHDVNRMRSLRFKDVIFNDLVGDFDEKGKYVIAENIEVDLVNLKKEIVENSLNGVEGRAVIDDRVFTFNVTPPQPLGNGNAYCYLQLLEELPRVNGYYIDTLTSTIATYEYKNDEYFFDNALKVFDFFEKKGVEDDDKQILPDSLRARFVMLAQMREQAYDPLDKLEEAYFNKRLQLLSEDPELAIILAEFANKRNKLEPYFANAEHKYIFLNQILDEVLDTAVAIKALDKSPSIKEQLKEADNKAYGLAIKVEEKVRQDNTIEKAQENVMFTENIGEKSQPKPANKNVKVNKGGNAPKKEKSAWEYKSNAKGNYVSPYQKSSKDKGNDKQAGGGGGMSNSNDDWGKTNKKSFNNDRSRSPTPPTQTGPTMNR